MRFAHDIATVLYSEKRPDPNLNKYSSNFYPLTPEFLSPYPNPYPYPNPCITHTHTHRGAEAGGILGINTPHFLEGLKKWELERERSKNNGGGARKM